MPNGSDCRDQPARNRTSGHIHAIIETGWQADGLIYDGRAGSPAWRNLRHNGNPAIGETGSSPNQKTSSKYIIEYKRRRRFLRKVYLMLIKN